ncbi:MAG TPA: sulfite exporter TauE/SafE family protein [Pseudolabrys sp.]|nr:sulfite exporter TauE/SafE family protein [Pseudolabrys sp.]
MDILTASFLVGAGTLAGVTASLVGGAAVVLYPAAIAVGVPPQAAAVTVLVSLMPGIFLAALADRSQLPPFNRDFVSLIVISITGAALGGACLLLTPGPLFAKIVPLLLAFATAVFALSGRIGAWMQRRAADRGHEIRFNVSSLKVLLPVSFYGGYFNAGVGIMLLGVFSVATGGDYRSANVAKNLVSSLNGLAASIVFIAQGAVHWPPTLALMAGTIMGGLAGSYLARIVPQAIVRVLVVMAGVALTLAMARKYWF